MKTNKRIALGALAVGLLLALAAVPSVRAIAADSEGSAQATQNEAYEHLWQMRNIMHFAAFTAQTTPKGVTVTVSATDPALVTTIQREFTEQHATLVSPLEGSTVTASKAENGVTLAFSSEDVNVVKALQSYGPSLGYTLLRNNMYAAMTSLNGNGGWGPGTAPGWGRGYGPGRMGPGWGRGYGPGMMGPGYGRGWGMMGGYGHGWMHGYGPGGGYGPQTPPY